MAGCRLWRGRLMWFGCELGSRTMVYVLTLWMAVHGGIWGEQIVLPAQADCARTGYAAAIESGAIGWSCTLEIPL